MLKELEDLGLSEKEAKIYYAALQIGRATADQLAKQANIVRPTAYVQIKSLMEKGLMSTYEEGKKTFFAPESPESLRRVLDVQKEAIRTREDELKRLLPELSNLFDSAGERPVVRFFEGKPGISSLRELALKAKSKEHMAIYSYESLSSLYTKPERDEYSQKRIENGITVKSIVSTHETESRSTKALSFPKFVLSKDLPVKTDMVAYDDKLNIVLFEKRPFGILIENKEVVDSFRAIFNLLWEKI